MSNSRDIADSAATINYIDGLTSDAQTQLDSKAVYPSQTGNEGKFLSTDGTTTNWGEVAASPSLDATASGAISNGDLVSINADGTVSTIEDVAPSLGVQDVVDSVNCQNLNFAYDPVNGKVVAIIEGGAPDKAIVGTISGNSITWGTPVDFTADLEGQCQIAFDTSAEKFIFFYSDGANANYCTAKTGTVSGTTITFGTPVVVASFYSEARMRMSVVYDPSTNMSLFLYGNTTAAYSQVGTLSGTSITLHGQTTNYSEYSLLFKGIYVPATQSIAAVHVDNNYRDTMGFNAPINASRKRWEPNRQVRLDWGSYATVPNLPTPNYPSSSFIPTIAVHPTEPHIFWGAAYTFENAYYLFSFSVDQNFAIQNRNVFIHGGIAIPTEDARNCSLAYDENAQRLVMLRNGNSAGECFVEEFTESSELGFKLVNTTSISDDFPGAETIACIYVPDERKIVLGYEQITTNYSASVVYTTGISGANNYIGISDADYADGATAKIQLVGSVDDAQSGLTAGKTHYVQRDGTLSTAPDNPKVVAGTAMSATSIIVKG